MNEEDKAMFERVRAQAEAGDWRSMIVLSSLYQEGNGCSQDIHLATVWMEKYIERYVVREYDPFSVRAKWSLIRQLSDLYVNPASQHTPNDAIRILKQGVDGGSLECTVQLARLYGGDLMYQRIPIDGHKAFEYYKLARDMIHLDKDGSRFGLVVFGALSDIYYQGQFTTRNYAMARDMAWKALECTDFGNNHAWATLGAIYSTGGYGVEKSKTIFDLCSSRNVVALKMMMN